MTLPAHRQCNCNSLFLFNKVLLILLVLVPAVPALAGFTDISAGLTGVSGGRAAWADFDNDGDLDLALTGATGSGLLSAIYRNGGGGAFTALPVILTGLRNGSLAWGDSDNDGDLDLLISGDNDTEHVTELYRNDGGGAFTKLDPGIMGLDFCAQAWGDYDSDGDLDLAVCGRDTGHAIRTRLYRNDGGNGFTNLGIALVYACYGDVAWGDYDQDGDLDLVFSGSKSASEYGTTVFRNDGSDVFTQMDFGLTGVRWSKSQWVDFDNDGDLDLFVSGQTIDGYLTTLYRNDGAAGFTDIDPGFAAMFKAGAAWGDYDNDGDPDLVITGFVGAEREFHIYRNDGGGVFTDQANGLPPTNNSALAWGDFDNDGDLDILRTGYDGSASHAQIFANDLYASSAAYGPNSAPQPPETLGRLEQSGGSVTLLWSAGSDTETPQSGLTYNLRVGTSSLGIDVVAPMAFLGSGHRLLPAQGINSGVMRLALGNLTPGGRYWWGVQTVDTGLAGSAFCTGSFVYQNAPPVPGDLRAGSDTDQPVFFGAGRFASAVSDEPQDELTYVMVMDLPAHGDLYLFGLPVAAGQVIAVSNLSGLVFVPDSGWQGDTWFAWRARDLEDWSTASGRVNIGVGPPLVETISLARNCADGVTALGGVSAEAGAAVTRRGFCYSQAPEPYTNDQVVESGTGAGDFQEAVSGLTPSSTYYFRAFATNVYGTTYGRELFINTGEPACGSLPLLLGTGGLLGAEAVTMGSAGAVAACDGTNTGGSGADGDAVQPDDEKKRRVGSAW